MYERGWVKKGWIFDTMKFREVLRLSVELKLNYKVHICVKARRVKLYKDNSLEPNWKVAECIGLLLPRATIPKPSKVGSEDFPMKTIFASIYPQNIRKVMISTNTNLWSQGTVRYLMIPIFCCKGFFILRLDYLTLPQFYLQNIAWSMKGFFIIVRMM